MLVLDKTTTFTKRSLNVRHRAHEKERERDSQWLILINVINYRPLGEHTKTSFQFPTMSNLIRYYNNYIIIETVWSCATLFIYLFTYLFTICSNQWPAIHVLPQQKQSRLQFTRIRGQLQTAASVHFPLLQLIRVLKKEIIKKKNILL